MACNYLWQRFSMLDFLEYWVYVNSQIAQKNRSFVATLDSASEEFQILWNIIKNILVGGAALKKWNKAEKNHPHPTAKTWTPLGLGCWFDQTFYTVVDRRKKRRTGGKTRGHLCFCSGYFQGTSGINDLFLFFIFCFITE